MIRGDNIVCGTSTTGTGTLTLAATPGPPGGIDFDVFARATGIGFANSAAVLVSYTIIEYTDSTFATTKATEKGIGTLTLGGSAGIANCTLARTTLQTSATSLNSQPATQNIAPGTGISIGTAANTLVFIGASAFETLAFPPYYDTAGGNIGVGPPSVGAANIGSSNLGLATAVHFYMPFWWTVPMLVKRVTMGVAVAYATGSPISNAYAHIYDIGSNGRPGKLLIDFGLLGSANTSLNSVAAISSAALTNAFPLMAGEYIFDFVTTFSGGATTPKMNAYNEQWGGGPLNSNRFGTVNITNQNLYATTDASGAANPAPDPAYTTGWSASSSGNVRYVFFLKES